MSGAGVVWDCMGLPFFWKVRFHACPLVRHGCPDWVDGCVCVGLFCRVALGALTWVAGHCTWSVGGCRTQGKLCCSFAVRRCARVKRL
jgi:hypothetical protein